MFARVRVDGRRTACLLDTRLHILARGLKRTGFPTPPVFSSSSFIMASISRLMSANVSKGIYGILCSMQYSSKRRPRRAKSTSASPAAGRSDTPSPMKTMRGISSWPHAAWAALRPSLTERALSWPSSVSWRQIGFHDDPSSLMSASLAMISMCFDCVGC